MYQSQAIVKNEKSKVKSVYTTPSDTALEARDRMRKRKKTQRGTSHKRNWMETI